MAFDYKKASEQAAKKAKEKEVMAMDDLANSIGSTNKSVKPKRHDANEMKTKSIRIYEEQCKALKIAAAETQKNESEIIREALDAWLKIHDGK